ncbi:MAG: SCO family protein [Verrucomicrobiota bacterium]
MSFRKDFILLAATLLVGASAVVSCDRNQPSPSPQSQTSGRTNYQVKGIVKELKVDGRTVVIQHEDVPGYMPAMTMPFKVKNTNELTNLQSEDRVSFQMVVTSDEGWIENVVRVGTAKGEILPSVESFRRVRDVDPLKVGDLMPDYRFTNELGHAVSLKDFKGKALALTFIFTRCPFPEFCPKLSNNFAEAYKRLMTTSNAPTNWNLLSISFDPTNDTPAVLKAYAGRYNYDSNYWSFVTGAMIDIDAITEQFGLGFSRQGPTINHNLRTVVVDANGRVRRILTGNDWKAAELVEEIGRAAVGLPSVE